MESYRKVLGVYDLVNKQNEWRGGECINLIASENMTSKAVRKATVSDFMHRYAEGHPDARYYNGTKIIDIIESEAEAQMKELIGCNFADVRPISGTNANESVFHRYMKGKKVMVNSIPAGGHISHHKPGSVGKYASEIVDIPLTKDGYHTDVAKTVDMISNPWTRPDVVVLGKSLFLFPEPVKEIAEVCNEYGVVLIYDAAHVFGLIAGKQFQDPLGDGAKIMTASTHKTFPGTQRGVILADELPEEDRKKIDGGVFPGSSSNHHLYTLPGLLVAIYEMMEFGQEYALQTTKNAKAFAKALDKYGFDVQGRDFGYTESHQVVLDVRKSGGGSAVAQRLEENGNIIVNKNGLFFDTSVKNPSGVRTGVQEATRMGMKEAEMEYLAQLVFEAVIKGKDVKAEVKKLRENFMDVQYSFDDRLAQDMVFDI